MTLKDLLMKTGIPSNKVLEIKKDNVTVCKKMYKDIQFRELLPYMGYKVQYVFIGDYEITMSIKSGSKFIKKIKRFLKKFLTK